MTVADKTTPSQIETIAFEIDLHHAPQKVWRALTDPALLSEWLLPVIGFRLELSSSFAFKAPPQPGWDGTVKCRVLAVEPHKRLSYTWAVGDMELDTIVTFTLAPTPSGTRLSIVQSGFKPGQKRASGGARYGWKMMGGKLIELLERIP